MKWLFHHGRLDSFPPYVGGDDDTIDEWQAVCDCGWNAERRWSHVTGAYDDLVKHLNGALRESVEPLIEQRSRAVEALSKAHYWVDSALDSTGETDEELAAEPGYFYVRLMCARDELKSARLEIAQDRLAVMREANGA